MSDPQFQQRRLDAPPLQTSPHPTALQRFVGGPPAAVALRLLFVSLIVGALLVWLDVRPQDLFMGVQRMIHRIWMLGWDAVHEVVQYVVAGAVIVLPIWLIIRFMNMRGPR